MEGNWLNVEGMQVIGYISVIILASTGVDAAPYMLKATQSTTKSTMTNGVISPVR